MRASSAWCSAIVIAALLSGGACTRKAVAQEAHGELTPLTAPSEATRELFENIRDYRTWRQFPDEQEPIFSKGHEGTFVVAFANAPVFRAMQDSQLPLPDGSIIVKENRRQPDAAPLVLTTMWKRNGGWYWVKHAPEMTGVFTLDGGAPIAGMRISACEGCHGLQAHNDFIFMHAFQNH